MIEAFALLAQPKKDMDSDDGDFKNCQRCGAAEIPTFYEGPYCTQCEDEIYLIQLQEVDYTGSLEHGEHDT